MDAFGRRDIGFMTIPDLMKLRAAGLTPAQAVDAVLSEGRSRAPTALAVVTEKRYGGFAIVAIGG